MIDFEPVVNTMFIIVCGGNSRILKSFKRITDKFYFTIIFCLYVFESRIISKQTFAKTHLLLKFQSILRPSHVDIDADNPITYDELQEWGQVNYSDEVGSSAFFRCFEK